ncbi:hypothetical protein BH20ACT24_BH20ACT24_10360 [soil metagenome]
MIIWNLVVTVALVAMISAATTGANADDQATVFTSRPVGPLNDGGDGSSTTTDDIIESTLADELVTVQTTGLSTAHSHICLVTASAEATFVADGTYIFGLSLDGAATSAASNRRIEMFNNPDVNDDSFEEVSTTFAFSGLSGDHTFTFSARKSSAWDGNLNVSASAMTVVCMRIELDL